MQRPVESNSKGRFLFGEGAGQQRLKELDQRWHKVRPDAREPDGKCAPLCALPPAIGDDGTHFHATSEVGFQRLVIGEELAYSYAMKLGVLFGMTMIALLDVVRTQFERSYGRKPSDSVEYVLTVSLGLLLLFYAFPEWDC